MIEVTEAAKEELKRLLEDSVDWPGARLRLLDRGHGKLGLGIDIEADGDRVVEYEGDVLLLVEDDLAARLNRVMIDVEDTGESTELVICKLA